ncbi:hypothetical protein I203_104312 [Kwoniella mangroviensis CBS 8507]|uniref:uncharacterized protein n=1 Tax=Kwoniella mangroviensis CBS 8507 TaxID=1296122 RepID=UPI00080CF76B|nr:uncharacterized protein I203_00741 [Kwoniella mangroviensis CBS 8507]OCF70606.1 hypothetical protein I203_00741 [Kwoniella mangroviensis CBS 8507]
MGENTTERGWMKIGHGDSIAYKQQLNQWEFNQSILSQHHENYGLPSNLEELDEDQLDILKDLISHSSSSSSSASSTQVSVSSIKPVSPIFEEVLHIDLFIKECPITCKNFKHLLLGDKGISKISNKPLHYKNVRIHRLVKDFIIQGGDITRNDGSGGESIYGPKFNDEKPGLKKQFGYGTIAMASGSSKNSNSSQFFICLIPNIQDGDTKEEKERKKKQFGKLDGKYVVFGQVSKESLGLLAKLNALEVKDGGDGLEGCWIDDCGIV